jgi:hypothetical protein
MLNNLSYSDQIDLCTGVGGGVLCLLCVILWAPVRGWRMRQLLVVFGLLSVNGVLSSRVFTYFVCRAVKRGNWVEAAMWMAAGSLDLLWTPPFIRPAYGLADYCVFWVLLNVARSEEEKVWLRVFVQVLAGCPLGLHGVELYHGFLQQ